jgi:hypothetical protein
MWNIPATTTGASGLVATTISSRAERNVAKVRRRFLPVDIDDDSVSCRWRIGLYLIVR